MSRSQLVAEHLPLLRRYARALTGNQASGDAYVGAALDLFAPDIGPLRYLDTGVPGIRVGVRYTAYVQGWDSATTFEVGLIWRWGVPIDLYRHWTMRRSTCSSSP